MTKQSCVLFELQEFGIWCVCLCVYLAACATITKDYITKYSLYYNVVTAKHVNWASSDIL